MRRSFKTYFLVVLASIITLGTGYLENFLANSFTDQQYFFPIAVAIVVAGGVYLLIRWRQSTEVDIDVDAIRDETAEKEYAQRGLIVFLSLYRPLGGKAKSLTPEEIQQAARACNYEALDLENTANTTLGHQIKAIKSHISKLEHCWIICTRATGQGKTQSLDYAPVFVKYISDRLSSTLKLHYGENYSVMLDDDTNVCRNTYRLVKKNYKEAKRLGLKKDEIVTDITGGFRAITIGAILACLDKDEDVQYIGTKYNEEGNPTGEAFPMILQYQPEIIERD